MNKILTVAILVGLSGTSLLAAPAVKLSMDLQAKFPIDLQAKLKSIETAPISIINPVEPYVKGRKEKVTSDKAEVEKLKKDNPYLSSDPVGAALLAGLESNYTSIDKDLSDLQSSAQTQSEPIETLLLGTNALIEALKPLATFPVACKGYKAEIITGYVKIMSGSATQYAFYKEDRTDIPVYATFLPTGQLGQIKTGAEYVVSIARNSLVSAQIRDDADGKKVVVCMDLIRKLPEQPIPPRPRAPTIK